MSRNDCFSACRPCFPRRPLAASIAHACWPTSAAPMRASRSSWRRGSSRRCRCLPAATMRPFADAMRAYLASPAVAACGKVAHAAVAIANPVDGDQIRMTNHHWQFSIEALRREVGSTRCWWSTISMRWRARCRICRMATRCRSAAAAACGGATGPARRRHRPRRVRPDPGRQQLDGLVERRRARHVFAGQRTRSRSPAIRLARVRACFGRALPVGRRRRTDPSRAGPYQGRPAEGIVSAPEISRRALAGECALSSQVIDVFCGMLGTVAGNLAVTLGAQGGVYIGGGIVPRLGERFASSPSAAASNRRAASLPTWPRCRPT
jgi:glucokinase